MSDYQYAIAIQVKDYEGVVDDSVIEQINKADDYWENTGNLKLIEKMIIVTKAEKEINTQLTTNNQDIKIIYAGELKDLLARIAKNIIGMK